MEQEVPRIRGAFADADPVLRLILQGLIAIDLVKLAPFRRETRFWPWCRTILEIRST